MIDFFVIGIYCYGLVSWVLSLLVCLRVVRRRVILRVQNLLVNQVFCLLSYDNQRQWRLLFRQ